MKVPPRPVFPPVSTINTVGLEARPGTVAAPIRQAGALAALDSFAPVNLAALDFERPLPGPDFVHPYAGAPLRVVASPYSDVIAAFHDSSVIFCRSDGEVVSVLQTPTAQKIEFDPSGNHALVYGLHVENSVMPGEPARTWVSKQFQVVQLDSGAVTRTIDADRGTVQWFSNQANAILSYSVPGGRPSAIIRGRPEQLWALYSLNSKMPDLSIRSASEKPGLAAWFDKEMAAVSATPSLSIDTKTLRMPESDRTLKLDKVQAAGVWHAEVSSTGNTAVAAAKLSNNPYTFFFDSEGERLGRVPAKFVTYIPNSDLFLGWSTERLSETDPIGLQIFDAKTGRAVAHLPTPTPDTPPQFDRPDQNPAPKEQGWSVSFSHDQSLLLVEYPTSQGTRGRSTWRFEPEAQAATQAIVASEGQGTASLPTPVGPVGREGSQLEAVLAAARARLSAATRATEALPIAFTDKNEAE